MTEWSELHIYIFLSELWPLCVTLTMAAGTLILHATIGLSMVKICAKLYWNSHMHVEVFSGQAFFDDLLVWLRSAWAPCHWFLLLGHMGVAFIERRLSLLILFFIFWTLDLETWFIGMALLLIVVNIYMRFH
jgi:hypothetical protein